MVVDKDEPDALTQEKKPTCKSFSVPLLFFEAGLALAVAAVPDRSVAGAAPRHERACLGSTEPGLGAKPRVEQRRLERDGEAPPPSAEAQPRADTEAGHGRAGGRRL